LRAALHGRRAGHHAVALPSHRKAVARETAEVRPLVDPDELRARLDRPFDVDELTAGQNNEKYLVAHP
jgi:hypothetical protein